MLTDAEIEIGKSKTDYNLGSQHHENNDCIRIAYEWLDAQNIIKSKTTKAYALKHLIEKWAGRYVSQSDVSVAAELHPDIFGKYPFFNISSRLVEPSTERLSEINEAFTQMDYRDNHEVSNYKVRE